MTEGKCLYPSEEPTLCYGVFRPGLNVFPVIRIFTIGDELRQNVFTNLAKKWEFDIGRYFLGTGESKFAFLIQRLNDNMLTTE